ncbi:MULTISPECIES: phosphatase PAP2 family protein [Gammaproteobacteria]|uniref:phosphatase PAP2 family protein n=1 Tax=Gammaproteobacteria TaxID=1236 RepID=UPI000DD02492|nr:MULTISPECIES: phosphatase PAP2 family protein [Gammaproteobacteria]RTE86750.1 phosphatase PAP2 family protein [Aliidiomarina sp. B3213]TCZ90696.1 phosphatase PAP2 family protein [Lysobacter sp. N42]
MSWLAQLQRFDEWMFFVVYDALKNITRYRIARWVSKSGDGYGYLFACIAAFAWGDPDAFWLLSLLLIGFAIELPVYWVLKNSLRRQRPYQRIARFKAVIIAHDQFSFPSGHTTAAFMFAGLCHVVMPSWTLLVYVWASAIGLSRVALGVHYPGDIFAGALLGSGLAYAVLQLGVPWIG